MSGNMSKGVLPPEVQHSDVWHPGRQQYRHVPFVASRHVQEQRGEVHGRHVVTTQRTEHQLIVV